MYTCIVLDARSYEEGVIYHLVESWYKMPEKEVVLNRLNTFFERKFIEWDYSDIDALFIKGELHKRGYRVILRKEETLYREEYELELGSIRPYEMFYSKPSNKEIIQALRRGAKDLWVGASKAKLVLEQTPVDTLGPFVSIPVVYKLGNEELTTTATLRRDVVAN